MAAVGVQQTRVADCVTKVSLSISCDHLLDMDAFSKSDPLCVLFMNSSENHWFEVGRTEKIENCLSPKFSKPIVLDYYFEMVQKLRFEVHDIDTENCSLQEADFLGQLECTLGQIVSSRKLTKPLVKKDKMPAGKGTITICAEEMTDNRVVAFEVAARKLDKKVSKTTRNYVPEIRNLYADDLTEVTNSYRSHFMIRKTFNTTHQKFVPL